jgi:hypothetical protein
VSVELEMSVQIYIQYKKMIFIFSVCVWVSLYERRQFGARSKAKAFQHTFMCCAADDDGIG